MAGGRIGVVRQLLALALLLGLFAACQKPILRHQSESRASEIVSTLQRHGIPASKQPDDSDRNTWKIVVPRDSEARAHDLLTNYRLLTPPQRGFADIFAQRSTIASAVEEQALLREATQGDLAQALRRVERVIEARVIVVPAVRQYGELVTPASASVMIQYQPTDEGTPPISDRDVRSIVGNGVADLDPDRVAVVMTPANISAPPRLQDTDSNLVSLGPLIVEERSVTLLKSLLGAGLILLGILGGLAFWQNRMVAELRRELSLARTGYMPSEQALAPPPEELHSI